MVSYKIFTFACENEGALAGELHERVSDELGSNTTIKLGFKSIMRRSSVKDRLDQCSAVLTSSMPTTMQGRVNAVAGLSIEIVGLGSFVCVGDRLSLASRSGEPVIVEVLGFRGAIARAMAFSPLDGIGPGSVVTGPLKLYAQGAFSLRPCKAWLGRVIDPLGQPIDDLGALPLGDQPRLVHASVPDATTRARLGARLDLGIAAMNLFTPCRAGQRLGLFAGSGVGKSTLLAMLARNTACDIAVLALVGERGREVREFLEDDLGPSGLARAVVVAATSDSSPLLRREAAYTAMTIAEYFRDQGKSVLLLMDSVTRFCLALREIGLSTGEPPATRGYPPSVFAELPRLLERAGPGPERGADPGQITALFTVLVEGDDHNEPVADAVRGILDGHVVADRRISEAGRYPAIDVLRSLSRAAPGCLEPDERDVTARARSILGTYSENADLVRLGAYKTGTDPQVDIAIAVAPRIEHMLHQIKEEKKTIGESFASLAAAMGMPNA